MRLPDFSRSVDFTRLRLSMGIEHIPELPPVQFVRTVTREVVREEVPPEAEQLHRTLPNAAVEVDDRSLQVVDGLLTVGGRKVAAYIRDQRQGVDWGQGITTYRFHVANCSTLAGMRRAGRENRYLATQRSDGIFEIRTADTWRQAERRGHMAMELCMNCRYELISSGRWFAPFNLTEFFKRHDTGVPTRIRRVEVVTETQTYQPNQEDISREYKAQAKYRCQECQVECSAVTRLLHLHHCDGDTSNNVSSNLRVLCVLCHSRQPMHVHMTRVPSFTRDAEAIRRLRMAQGIVGG